MAVSWVKQCLLQLRRYLYWRSVRRQARAYIRANSLRAVASAMLDLDRHAGTGDSRPAIQALKRALTQAFYEQGLCVGVCTRAEPILEGPAAAAERQKWRDGQGRPLVETTFLVEGRHYRWLLPAEEVAAALAWAPEGDPGPARRASPATCLLPECRDALMAVVYEYLTQRGVPLVGPHAGLEGLIGAGR